MKNIKKHEKLKNEKMKKNEKCNVICCASSQPQPSSPKWVLSCEGVPQRSVIHPFSLRALFSHRSSAPPPLLPGPVRHVSSINRILGHPWPLRTCVSELFFVQGTRGVLVPLPVRVSLACASTLGEVVDDRSLVFPISQARLPSRRK